MEEQHVEEVKKRLSRKMGSKNTSILIDRLGTNKQFINAIESPAGREIMAVVVAGLDEFAALFLVPGMDEKQWADLFVKYQELQASLRFHERVVNKINVYNKDRRQFEKAIGD